MLRQPVLAMVLVALALPGAASSQSSELKPRPEVKSWEFWIGDWILTGTAKDGPDEAECSVDWRAHGRWILEGAAAEFTTTWKCAGLVAHWVEILSWNPAKRTHTFTGFSSTGNVWDSTATIGIGGFVEDFLVPASDGRVSKCHNEWTFGENRLTVSGKSVCQLGDSQWTNFTVKGSKVKER